MNIRNLSVYAIIVAVAIAFMMALQANSTQNIDEWNYSKVREGAVAGDVIKATVENDRVVGETRDGTKFFAKVLETDFEFAAFLADQGVDVKVKPASSGFNFGFLMMLLFFGMIGFLLYMQYRQSGGGGGRGAMNFGKSRARLLTDKHGRVTFADVAGVDEAKEELQEVVEFLQDPSKFQRLGGKIPKGALLVGPPGTGKTLIARAVAGEANVPFFTISGSDFVEMFVGVGASRVRDMFEKAKQNAPCIIFIDEIDAVGRSRGAGLGGGNDEREQTLNQLLVEMDGFETNEGIILIAATNRPDVLDPALLRPGRFDRQVTVGNPDVMGREKILMVHMRNVPTATDVNPKVIARGTPGFSGADLANLVNEAALLAARRGKRAVAMVEFEDAKDKVLMGPERRSMVMSEDEKALTAWHEAGHAIVALKTPSADPVHKATIIPRGRALGMVMQLPEDDKYSMSKVQMTSRLAILMGGRAAEEVKFGKDNVTAGASSDIQQATKLARAMVTKWGYSEKVGFVDYSESPNNTFLGQQMGQAHVSEETSQVIESEVKGLVQEGMDTAMRILTEFKDQWSAIAEGLLEYETLTGDEINTLIAGGKIERPDTDGGDNGPGSAVPVIGKRKPRPKGGLGGAGEPSPA
jgi:cell division protease FtsH